MFSRKFFDEEVRLNRFFFNGVFYGVYNFVDEEGVKSQPLAFVNDNGLVFILT